MKLEPPPGSSVVAVPALQAYLLGAVDFEDAANLQRRLVYQVTGDRQQALLVLCEHAPLITVGRQGSRSHLRIEPHELRARQWQVRWLNRGGDCWLHLPGQIAVYAVLPLDALALTVQDYLGRLHQVFARVLDDFRIPAEPPSPRPAVYVNARPIARIGVAVRNWVTYYGGILNVNVDLEPFRRIHDPNELPMTSIQRERRGALRISMVRERLVEHFADIFGLPRVAIFFDHPSFSRKAPTDALAASS